LIFCRILKEKTRLVFIFIYRSKLPRAYFCFSSLCFYCFKSTISNAKNTKLICLNRKAQISKNFSTNSFIHKVAGLVCFNRSFPLSFFKTSLANLSLFSSKTNCLFCLKVKNISLSHSSKLKAKKRIEDL